MVNIKFYTDYSQSKVLSKLLSYESADMYYSKHDTIYADTLYDSCDIQFFQIRGYIPCWSLSALLEVLPKSINNEALSIKTSATLWYIGYQNYYTVKADNVINGCYELIVYLHELKLL